MKLINLVNCFLLTSKDTEAQRTEMICSSSHGKLIVQLGVSGTLSSGFLIQTCWSYDSLKCSKSVMKKCLNNYKIWKWTSGFVIVQNVLQQFWSPSRLGSILFTEYRSIHTTMYLPWLSVRVVEAHDHFISVGSLALRNYRQLLSFYLFYRIQNNSPDSRSP